MSSCEPHSGLTGKRKRRKDSNPNPLFSRWLAEWRDEAREKGWKSEYIYSRALRSLQKFPLPLETGKECKILQNFGDKICKMLDDRLLKHKQEQETQSEAASLSTDLSLAQSSVSARKAVPQPPATVHEISDSSDEDVLGYTGCDKEPSGSSSRNSATGLSGNITTGISRNSTPGISGNITTRICGNSITGLSGNNTTRLSGNSTTGVSGPQHVQRPLSSSAANVENDFQDDDVSITGHIPPVDSDVLSDPYCLSDEDVPVLPDLPDLAQSDGEDRLTENQQDGRVQGQQVAHGQMIHDISDSEEDETDEAVPPPQARGRAAGGRHRREYTPAYRSGSYAVLLTLYRQAQHPDFRGFMTKAELCRAAQPLADKSFTVPDPGSRYTAWSSVSSLIKKGFLTKESSPAKFRLTDEGFELASRLEEVERRHASGDTEREDGEEGGGHVVEGTVAERGGGEDGGGHAVGDVVAERGGGRLCGQDEVREGRKTATANKVVTAEKDMAEHDPCIIVDDVKAAEEICVDDDSGDEDDDELPPLTLPSLAERLQPCSSLLAPATDVTSENSKLRYWYVAEDDKLVARKDQASVVVDELGVSFLVKINYQHLLQHGCQYRLDMTRPLGDDFVFAYLSDAHCCEEAHPPEDVTEAVCARPPTAEHSRATCQGTSGTKRQMAGDTSCRPVHEISDSDSDPEEFPARPVAKDPASDYRQPSSSANNSKTQLPGKITAVSRKASSSTKACGKSKTFTSESCGKETGDGRQTGPAGSALASLQNIPAGTGESDGSTSSGAVPDFVLHPGTFEVVLCVDNREFFGSQSSSKSLLPNLIKNNVTCDLRLLSVGDVLWVARENIATGVPMDKMGREQPAKRELVLNYIVERKRMDDLVSSMTGGRWNEQKFRLKHSGLQEKIILIESYGSMQHFSISEDRIKQAIVNAQVIDGFTVKQTGDSKETAAYLTLMTRYLQSYYQNKTLRSCSRETLKELGVKFEVRDSEQMLMPFDHFNQASLKNKPLTVRELFARQLIQLWGMSADKARAVVDKYPTPSRLFSAYASCSSDKEKESLLANVKYGKNLRNLGIALSRQVAQLYNSMVLT